MSTTSDAASVGSNVRRAPFTIPALALTLALSVVPCIGAADAEEPRLVWEWNAAHSGRGVPRASVCDLDADGAPDVLLSERGKKGPWWTVALRGATGEELWRKDHDGRSLVRVACTPDGAAEVVVVRGRRLEILDGATGATTRSVELESEAGNVALACIDGDGAADIVCAVGRERDDRLLALSGSSLSPLWSSDSEPDDSRFGEGFGRMTCADSDGDGLDEIFAVENTDVLVRIDPDGSRRWSHRLGERTTLFPKGAATSAPLVADVTGDGLNEVVVGCLAGGLVVLEADTGELVTLLRFGVESHGQLVRGRRLPRFMRALLAESGEPVNDLLAIELDGYPGLDLVFGCSDGFVYAVSVRSGESLWRFDSEGTVHDSPTPLDASGDGLSDIVAWDSERAYVLNGRDGAALPELPRVSAPSALHAADLDADGVCELILIGRAPSTVAVWTTGVACALEPRARGCPEP